MLSYAVGEGKSMFRVCAAFAIVQAVYILVGAPLLLFLLFTPTAEIRAKLPHLSSPTASPTILVLVLVLATVQYIAAWITNRAFPALTAWALYVSVATFFVWVLSHPK
jgi:hypothetical protein